jgi:hypothetical protein
MILVVTNRQDQTADFLILELQKRSADYIRFNTEDFPQRVQITWHLDASGFDGDFVFPKGRVAFQDIQSIWYRRPVAPVPSTAIDDPTAYEFAISESLAALDCIWRTLSCFWVSHPDNLRKAELKLHQLKSAAEQGFRISPTLLTNDPAVAKNFYQSQNKEVIYKTLRRGRLVRENTTSLIYTSPISTQAEFLDQVVYAPSLLQRLVVKQIEIRVTVIGLKVFAVAIHSQEDENSRNDWRRGDITRLRHEPHKLPTVIEAQCLSLVHSFGLAFGAIDLILTPEGEYIFLEINPNGQWAWIQQLCPEIPLRETLADLLMQGNSQANT